MTTRPTVIRPRVAPPWLALAILLAAACSASGPARPEEPARSSRCALPEAPEIARRDGAAILEVWTVEADPALFAPGAPDDGGLAAFRRAVENNGADREHPAVGPERGAANADARKLWQRERENAELVYSGRGGKVRPIHCLEAILFARQHDRHSQLENPTEFVASILRRGDRVRVYFGAGDEMFPPKSVYGFDLVERDVHAGWRLDAVLHNHTVTRHEGRLRLGPPVPSTSDVQLMRGLAGDLGLRRVLVTNGLYTGEVQADALPRFEVRE